MEGAEPRERFSPSRVGNAGISDPEVKEGIELLSEVASAVLRMCGGEGKRILGMLDKSQLSILAAHVSTRSKILGRRDPLTKTLCDLNLTSVENSFIVPKKPLIMVAKGIIKNKRLYRLAKIGAKNSCPECLKLLQADGSCPSCGRRVGG